jgi:hypothetical protein
MCRLGTNGLRTIKFWPFCDLFSQFFGSHFVSLCCFRFVRLLFASKRNKRKNRFCSLRSEKQFSYFSHRFASTENERRTLGEGDFHDLVCWGLSFILQTFPQDCPFSSFRIVLFQLRFWASVQLWEWKWSKIWHHCTRIRMVGTEHYLSHLQKISFLYRSLNTLKFSNLLY